MHSPLRAKSSNRASGLKVASGSGRVRSSGTGLLLIAAISGRALAAAARRAGYRPLVTDMFCDSDTAALAERMARIPGSLQDGIDGEKLISQMKRLAGKDRPDAIVLGSGFERKADLVDEIAQHFPLAGNGGPAIRRIKDPSLLANDCAELGIPHPAFRWTPPPDPENWVAKTAGGAGGAHIKRAHDQCATRGRYFQRFVAGANISALFVADGNAAHIVGFSRQWASPAPSTPYRYGGAVRLKRFDRADAATVTDWLSRLACRAGLLGLCSADFIRAKDGYRLVEINPRPGATLDIFDSNDAPLMEAHLRACRGEAFCLPSFDDCMASMIAYASRPLPDFPTIAWPDWTADRQSPGTRLIAGDPICTVFARGPSAAATRRALKIQARQLEACWNGDRI